MDSNPSYYFTYSWNSCFSFAHSFYSKCLREEKLSIQANVTTRFEPNWLSQGNMTHVDSLMFHKTPSSPCRPENLNETSENIVRHAVNFVPFADII